MFSIQPESRRILAFPGEDFQKRAEGLLPRGVHVDRLDVQVLLENLDQLPTLPFVAVELLTKVQEEEVSAQDISRLIEKD